MGVCASRTCRPPDASSPALRTCDRSVCRHWAAAVAALLAVATAAAPAGGREPETDDDPLRFGKLVLRVFTDRDGLPQNSIESMVFSRDGLLWVCTRDGAARFDGSHWQSRKLPRPNHSNWPRTVLATADGAVWFGSEDSGVHRLDHGRWTTFGVAEGLPSGQVRALAELPGDNGGPTVWVGTSAGVAVIRDGVVSRLDAVSGPGVSPVTAILAVDGTNRYWVATEGRGLFRLERGMWTHFTTADGLPSDIVRCVIEGDAGGGRTLLAGTGAGLARLDHEHFAAVQLPLDGARPIVNALLEATAPGGGPVLWVGTEGDGLVRLENGEGTVLDVTSGLPSDFVFSLAGLGDEAGTRTVFVGTLTGLAQIQTSSWAVFDSSSGLPDNTVVSLLETTSPTGASQLWFGTAGGGLARLEDGRWSVFDQSTGLGGGSAFSLLETTGGTGPKLWVGTNRGLSLYAGGRWRHFTSADGLPAGAVVSMVATPGKDGDEVVWAGTYGGGLGRLEHDRWQIFSSTDGTLPDDRVEGLLETTAGDGGEVLWVATDRGIARHHNGTWHILDHHNGLPNDLVRSLHLTTWASGTRTLWVGTGAGLAWTDADAPEPRFAVVTETTVPALPNNVVYRIEQDADARLYVGTNRGVARITVANQPPMQLSDLAITSYTVTEGLPSNECSFGASMVDSQGRVWFGTVGGAAVFDPARDLPDRQEKPLHIEHATVLGPDRSLRPGERLAYDEGDLVFKYQLLSFFRGQDTQYRSRLVGFEASPTAWGHDRSRTFTNLRAGDYTFRVWGRDSAGNESGPIELSFSVAQPPWRTWWGMALSVIGVLAIGTSVIRLRVQALNRRNLELEALVDLRTGELEAANRTLEAMSVTDPLTGVRNRRFVDEWLPVELAQVRTIHAAGRRRASAAATDLILVLLDLDHFKLINDVGGHSVGDKVLCQVVRTLQLTLRDEDTVVRWGGEEFLLIIRVTDRQSGPAIAERVRTAVAAARTVAEDGTALSVTCSLGFAPYPFRPSAPAALSWEDVVSLIDAALYAAKHSGRDAWVGLKDTGTIPDGELRRQLKEDLTAAVAAGDIAVTTSLGHPQQLRWNGGSRDRQANGPVED